jgi:hypothetical protein
MSRPKYVTIDGKRHLWKDVVAQYREQAAAAARPEQPLLFAELHFDVKPVAERTAADRYANPGLFDPKL